MTVIMETVDELNTIDGELDEFFKKKQRNEFLNTLTDKALDECTIHKFLNTLTKRNKALDECTIHKINLNDFEGISEDEAPQEKLSESEGDEKNKLLF
uniref:Uncharacterized protein n=1 Tax=Lactuca sativa TaxID=4236 RepID=A0A9R1WKU4_LACSA|nr:hypothetical protein LSAT_V11C100002960 [Lactuca sativa]